jgi:hypothetical protein
MLLFALLHLTKTQAVNPDYETIGRSSVTLEDIKTSRQLGSACPGHPISGDVVCADSGARRHPCDPHDNMIAGAGFRAGRYNRFGYPGLFAAYNAGPEPYDPWLKHGTLVPAETLAYLRAISSDVAECVLAMGAASGSGGSGSTRVASFRPQIEPKSQSGRSLFFVFGNQTFAALGPSNHVAEIANQDADQHSIFVTPTANHILLRHQKSALCWCRCHIAPNSLEGRDRRCSAERCRQRSEPRVSKIKDTLLQSVMCLSAHPSSWRVASGGVVTTLLV